MRKTTRLQQPENLEPRNLLTSLLVDLDGDLDVDVLEGGSWLENDGSGNFETHDFSTRKFNAIAGDVDGDGDLDIVTSEPSWFENVDGHFSVSHPIQSSQRGMDSIRLFDVGGDGDLDLIATTDEFAFLFRNEDGVLIQQEQHALTDQFLSVTDFDLDGDLDFLACEKELVDCIDREVWLDRGDSTNGFEREILLSNAPLQNVSDAYFLDVDGDGWDDVLLSSVWTAELSQDAWRNSNGTGVESSLFTSFVGEGNAFYRDIDGDGDLDQIAFDNSYFWWSLNVGGDFIGCGLEATHLPPIWGAEDVADFNQDGIFDLYAGNGRWYDMHSRQLHDPASKPITELANQVAFVSSRLDDSFDNAVLFADFNSDGRQDIIAGTDTDWRIQIDNDGDNLPDQISVFPWQRRQVVDPIRDDRYFEAKDADNDGDIDILGIGLQGSDLVPVFVENTDGLGNFALRYPATEFERPYTVLSWQSVDMDRDGVLDVVAVIWNRADKNYELTVLLQDAARFSAARIATMPIRTGALIEFEIQDIDRDGDPDIGLLTQQNELFWVMNEDGNFVPTTNQVSSDEFAIADDDGSSWLLTSSDSNVYRQSDGDFELVQEMSLFSTDVRWFDVDGDGDQDLVEVSEYAVSWFEQTDDGLFPFRRMIGTSYFRSQDVRVLDWDGDGDLDVLRRDVLGWTLMEQRFAGDSNNDGIFNSGDLVQVFQSGLYEAGASASFEQGDWNGDGVFDSADLVYVFQRDAYTYDAKWADAKWASDLASMIDANWRFAKQTTGRRR